MASLGKPIDLGAICDLSTNSVPITTMQASPIPAHALVGTGGPELLDTASRPMGPLYRAIFLAIVVTATDVFGFEEHDVVVPGLSQEGALPSAATTAFGFPDGIHFNILAVTDGNTGSTAYSDRVRELLDTRTSESVWDYLPANSSLLAGEKSNLATLMEARERASAANEAAEGVFNLTITSPDRSTIVTPGSTITVTVTVDPEVTVDQIVVVGIDEAINDTAAPFEVSFPVPLEAFRTYSITAFGRNNTTDEYFASAPVDLIAQPAATLETLRIDPVDAFLLGAGDTLQLSVTGLFSDAIPREVPGAEVTWTSQHPSIATVDSSGLVTAVTTGVATIQANSQTLQTTRTVKVLPRPPLIFVDNFESGDTSWWSGVSP